MKNHRLEISNSWPCRICSAKKLEALGGEARYKELKAIEAKYNALHVEFFDSEEDAPEMDPALVEELEAINKVKTTLNHIESARAKRVEIRT